MEILENLTGSHFEIGYQRGEALRPLIWEHIERMKFIANENNPALHPDDLIDGFVANTGHLAAVQKYTPLLLEEVKGISQGSNIPFNDIFATCCLDELWRYSQSFSNIPSFSCSSLGCFRENNSPALLGQNLDTDEISKNLAVVLHIKGPDQPEAFIVCHASNLGWMGLNRSPLGVCVNTIHLMSNRDGLPIQFISREILRKTTLADAVDFVTHVKQGAAQNFMIGDAEQVIDLEKSANNCFRYIPYEDARRVYHTNHPLVNKEWISNYPVIQENSLNRFKYLEFRLKNQTKPIELENIKGILRSHNGPICRHSDHKSDGHGTWVSVIYSLSNPPEMYVAEGNPCETEYKYFHF